VFCTYVMSSGEALVVQDEDPGLDFAAFRGNGALVGALKMTV